MREIGKVRIKYHICEMLSYAFTFPEAQAFLHSLSSHARLFLEHNYNLLAVTSEDDRYLHEIFYSIGENWTSNDVTLGQFRSKGYMVPQEGIKMRVQKRHEIVQIVNEGVKVTELTID